jgi:dihydropteroate synthase/2-amino-4-hydroxy-6-hydroxymethyldihydropteridine diphosphokinase
MYFTDQPPFLNAVAELHTNLDAVNLLDSLQVIEKQLGRDAKATRFGPRPVDLDIVLFNSDVVSLDNDKLTIPHPRLHERGFVLQPLCDIDDGVRIPSTNPAGPARTSRELLDALSKDENAGMRRVLPLCNSSAGVLEWGGRPKMMGIINTSPDSFSDGGYVEDIDSALRRAETFARFGFDVMDVGGQSTRPGAKIVSESEELRRVEPIVRAIRDEHPGLAISVDTFRASVAGAAIDAGADMVNDVSAGRLDPKMIETVLLNRCAWAMMHMRGTPETMMTPKATTYGPGSITSSVAAELLPAVAEAERAGVPRWDVLVDPGLGFAKNASQSCDLARQLPQWKYEMGDFPSLIGLSRKSLLTHVVPRLCHEAPADRDFATAGAIVAAMHSGADMLRVHNPYLADVIRVAYDLWAEGN